MNEYYVLNDGTKIPKIGFGTYNEEFEDNKKAILQAIECGYKFFDGASLYETDRSLGRVLEPDCMKTCRINVPDQYIIIADAKDIVTYDPTRQKGVYNYDK